MTGVMELYAQVKILSVIVGGSIHGGRENCIF